MCLVLFTCFILLSIFYPFTLDFFFFSAAKIFRVSSNGEVSKCTSADSLSIFRYRNKIPGRVISHDSHMILFSNAPNTTSGQPPGFLQCGDFIYPLVPGKSPVLHTSKRAYVFPDVTSETEGPTVGLMLERMPKDELEELNHVSQSHPISLLCKRNNIGLCDIGLLYIAIFFVKILQYY